MSRNSTTQRDVTAKAPRQEPAGVSESLERESGVAEVVVKPVGSRPVGRDALIDPGVTRSRCQRAGEIVTELASRKTHLQPQMTPTAVRSRFRAERHSDGDAGRMRRCSIGCAVERLRRNARALAPLIAAKNSASCLRTSSGDTFVPTAGQRRPAQSGQMQCRPQPHQGRDCTAVPTINCSKISYLTPNEAGRALRAVRARGGDRIPSAVHPCCVCRAWHLTSKPFSGRRKWWTQPV